MAWIPGHKHSTFDHLGFVVLVNVFLIFLVLYDNTIFLHLLQTLLKLTYLFQLHLIFTLLLLLLHFHSRNFRLSDRHLVVKIRLCSGLFGFLGVVKGSGGRPSFHSCSLVVITHAGHKIFHPSVLLVSLDLDEHLVRAKSSRLVDHADNVGRLLNKYVPFSLEVCIV